MEIETRTPDEMLDGAVERMTKIGEWHLKAFPRLKLEIGKKYRYPFDKLATYEYIGHPVSRVVNGVKFPDNFFHILQRESDGAIMKATKYSDSPELI